MGEHARIAKSAGTVLVEVTADLGLILLNIVFAWAASSLRSTLMATLVSTTADVAGISTSMVSTLAVVSSLESTTIETFLESVAVVLLLLANERPTETSNDLGSCS